MKTDPDGPERFEEPVLLEKAGYVTEDLDFCPVNREGACIGS